MTEKVAWPVARRAMGGRMWLLQLDVGDELFSHWPAWCSSALSTVLCVRRQAVERQPPSSATGQLVWR